MVTFFVGMNAYAAQPGLYLGGQIGWGNVSDTGISTGNMNQAIGIALGHSNYSSSAFNTKTSESGLAWRVLGGYQVGYNWAAEIGWAVFPRLPINATATGFDRVTGLPFIANGFGTYKTSAFDAVAKFIYPIPCHFNLSAKLGLAYMHGWASQTVTVLENAIPTGDATDINTTNRLYPTGSVGIGYDFRPDITTDLTYTRIQQIGSSTEIGSIDTVLISLEFHFG
jgi:hypothetical protein